MQIGLKQGFGARCHAHQSNPTHFGCAGCHHVEPRRREPAPRRRLRRGPSPPPPSPRRRPLPQVVPSPPISRASRVPCGRLVGFSSLVYPGRIPRVFLFVFFGWICSCRGCAISFLDRGFFSSLSIFSPLVMRFVGFLTGDYLYMQRCESAAVAMWEDSGMVVLELSEVGVLHRERFSVHGLNPFLTEIVMLWVGVGSQTWGFFSFRCCAFRLAVIDSVVQYYF